MPDQPNTKQCDGSGQFRKWKQNAGEFKSYTVPCPGCPACRPCKRCGGTGSSYERYDEGPGQFLPCGFCNGAGVEPDPPEQERCPACGSDDPDTCGRGIHRHDHGLTDRWHPGPCCDNPFHSPPTGDEGEAVPTLDAALSITERGCQAVAKGDNPEAVAGIIASYFRDVYAALDRAIEERDEARAKMRPDHCCGSSRQRRRHREGRGCGGGVGAVAR